MENSGNEQFINFKSCALLSGVMKSCASLLRPSSGVNHPCFQHIHTIYSTLSLVTCYQISCFDVPAVLILLNKSLKGQE